jgi:uncharacterized BrkB/YihY/UPF0761 family membrane protein
MLSPVRVLSIAWLLVAIAVISLPLHHGWIGWPQQAIDYKKWVLYSAGAVRPLFSFYVLFFSYALLPIGAALSWKWVRAGAFVHVAGLVCLGYGVASNVPSINDNFEVNLLVIQFLLSGAYVTAALLAPSASKSAA